MTFDEIVGNKRTMHRNELPDQHFYRIAIASAEQVAPNGERRKLREPCNRFLSFLH